MISYGLLEENLLNCLNAVIALSTITSKQMGHGCCPMILMTHHLIMVHQAPSILIISPLRPPCIFRIKSLLYQITTESGTSIPITAQNLVTPHKNLGHLICPSRCTTKQIEQNISKAQQIQHAIVLHYQLTWRDTSMLYHTIFRPSME